MTETKDQTGKTTGGGARKPLTLQRTVESGQVRQNFSHGRSKAVVVEKKKTRKLAGSEPVPERPTPIVEQRVLPPREMAPPAAETARQPAASRTLSVGEQDARARALAAAREREVGDRAKAVEADRERAVLAAEIAAQTKAPVVNEHPIAASQPVEVKLPAAKTPEAKTPEVRITEAKTTGAKPSAGSAPVSTSPSVRPAGPAAPVGPRPLPVASSPRAPMSAPAGAQRRMTVCACPA